MRQTILLGGAFLLVTAALAETPSPLSVTVPTTLCRRSHRVNEALETVWQPDLQGYQGRSSTILPPGMYRVLVSGPSGPGQGYKVLVGDGVPELWRPHGQDWEAELVYAPRGGPLFLWQDRALPLRAVALRCEPNLAAARPYRMDPAPNFRHGGLGACCDPRDNVQLTDGSALDPWPSDPFSVGWESVNQVAVTIDLGDLYDLSRVYVNMAGGGRDGVYFPLAIKVEGALSNTLQLPLPQPGSQTGPLINQTFFLLGQWLNPKLAEPGDKQVLHQPIAVQGRAQFVRVTFYTSRALTLFMDEIEVY